MFNVKVKGKGHGYNWAKYPVEFEFSMNGDPSDYSESEIRGRARRELKRKTACDSVEIDELSVILKIGG
jgi:hypothetical protein